MLTSFYQDVFFALLYVISDVVSASAQGYAEEYKPCPGVEYHFDGYTYKLDPVTREKMWSHCSFPNPHFDHALCGRPRERGVQYFMCDPDNLLDNAQGAAIDNHLETIRRKTSVICTGADGDQETFRVSVVMVNRMRLPDLNSTSLCITDCGFPRPDLDATQPRPDADGQEEIMRIFADGVRQLWNYGSCGNDVLVFYCKEFNKVYISPGTRASHYLTHATVSNLRNTFTSYIDDHGYRAGLELGLIHLLDSLKVSLQGFSTAKVILVLDILTVLVIGGLLWLYMFKKNFQINVWEDEMVYKLWEAFLKLVAGVWLVELVVMTIAGLSLKSGGQGLFWCLGVAVAALAGVVTLYVLSVDIYD